MGVDVFFVLSGFLFTVIIRDRKVIYHKFLYNRVLRIFPLFFVALSMIMATQDNNGINTDFFWYFLTFSYNTNDIRNAIPMWSIWTIGTEFRFYFVLPLILAVLYRKSAKTILGWMLILILCAAMVKFQGKGNFYHAFLSRLNQFLTGILAGYWYLQGRFAFLSKSAVLTNIMTVLWLALLTVFFWSIKFVANDDIFNTLRWTLFNRVIDGCKNHFSEN